METQSKSIENVYCNGVFTNSNWHYSIKLHSTTAYNKCILHKLSSAGIKTLSALTMHSDQSLNHQCSCDTMRWMSCDTRLRIQYESQLWTKLWVLMKLKSFSEIQSIIKDVTYTSLKTFEPRGFYFKHGRTMCQKQINFDIKSCHSQLLK